MTNPSPNHRPAGRASKSAPPAWPRWSRCSSNAASNSSNCPAATLNWPPIRASSLKDSYWRWPERNLAGNAIDFFVQVLGLSFHDAMRQITGP